MLSVNQSLSSLIQFLRCGAIGGVFIGLPCAVLAQGISIAQFAAEAVDENSVRLEVSAHGEDIDVGSYFVHLSKQPTDAVLPGFYIDANNRQYLLALPTGRYRMNFVDNGRLDEAPEEGTFAITIPTKDWEDGRYELELGAHNRPAEGAYLFDKRLVEVRVQEGKPSVEVIEKPEIKITAFDVQEAGPNKTKVTVAAEGRGIDIGSFNIRVDRRPPGGDLPGFLSQQGFDYLAQMRDGKLSTLLEDNGPLDEDPRRDVFAMTLDSRKWPRGQYALFAAAHNRPASGRYISDRTEYFNIDVGETEASDIGNIPGAEHGIIYKEDGVYACFPSLIELPDGRLMVTMGTRTNRSHIDTAGGQAFRVSEDQGKTWKPTSEAYTRKEWRTSDGRYVTADVEGWVQAPSSELPRLKEENKYIYPGGEVRPGVTAYLGGALARSSSDQGVTWQKTPIELEDCVGVMGYNKAANEIVTRNGVRLLAYYGYRSSLPHEEGASVYIIRSEDEGRTWTGRPMYPEPPNPNLTFNETALVETAEGKILALMRIAIEHPEDDSYLWIAESEDDGKTWSQPRRSEMWGYPACARLLPNGDIIAAYGYRRRPMGIRAAISRDHGKTWDIKNELILRDDALGAGGDNGYPMLQIFEDGEILAVYYISTDHQNTHIAYTRFRVPGTEVSKEN